MLCKKVLSLFLLLESVVDAAQTLSPGLLTRCLYYYGYYIKYVITTLLHCYYIFINHHNKLNDFNFNNIFIYKTKNKIFTILLISPN